jgi:hypothetical protein
VLALWTLISLGFGMPGRTIRWRVVGRFVFLNGGILTARPVVADL